MPAKRKGAKPASERLTPVKRKRSSAGGRAAKVVKNGSVSSDDQEYVVEAILEKRMVRGKPEYMIKWKNYSHTQNTWEPPAHLKGCAHLLEAFEKAAKEAQNETEEDEDTETGGEEDGGSDGEGKTAKKKTPAKRGRPSAAKAQVKKEDVDEEEEVEPADDHTEENGQEDGGDAEADDDTEVKVKAPAKKGGRPKGKSGGKKKRKSRY